MALDFTKAVDRVRLAVGDTNELPIFPDTLYQQVLDKNSGDEQKTSLEMAQYILGYISQNGFRERAASYEVYGREWLQSYRDFLKTFLLSAGNANVLGAKTYAGGISLSDMATNDANLDNNLVPTTDANTLLETDNGYLRF